MVGIYKITSPTSRIYIGQSLNIDKRWKDYKNISRVSRQPKLYNSLNKYGWKQHQFEIIEECEISKLDERELYWKQHYLNLVENNWKQVLFCDLHDMGGGPRSNETKQKISESLKGKIHSYETKDKIRQKKIGTKRNISSNKKTSDKLKGIIRKDETKKKMSLSKKGNNYRIGSKQSNISKEKISQANSKPKPEGFGNKISKIKQGKKINNNKPILQYNLEGNFIKEWNSSKEAEQHFNPNSIKTQDNIGGVCRGVRKTAYKFKWKFKKDE